jgi:hypothetical protein
MTKKADRYDKSDIFPISEINPVRLVQFVTKTLALNASPLRTHIVCRLSALIISKRVYGDDKEI